MNDNWEKWLENKRDDEALDIPEGYFREMEASVIDRWKRRKSLSKRFERVMTITWQVAAVVLLLLVWRGPNTQPTDIIQEMSSEELAYYYIQMEPEISLYDLWMDVSDVPIDTLEHWILTENILDEDIAKEIH
ncbi:MAG: hypothetical protein R3275_11555 [Saprospiraceae bacterium]|nr:hypothetical protein [Saprospiraceae bacterium]